MLRVLDFGERCYRKAVRAYAIGEFRAGRPVYVAPQGTRIVIRDLAEFDAVMGTSAKDMMADDRDFYRSQRDDFVAGPLD